MFERHKLREIDPWNADSGKGEYIFAEPGTNAYSMRIIFRPNVIIVYGDIRPCAIFIQHEIDLPWLRGSVKDPNYLFQKAVCGIEKKYDAVATKEYARELLLERGYDHDHIDLAEVDWDDIDAVMDFFEHDYEALCHSYAHVEVLRQGLEAFCKAELKEE